MRTRFLLFLMGLLLGVSLLAVEPNLQTMFAVAPTQATYCVDSTAITPLLSPEAQDEFVQLIRSSLSTVDVEMYVFTSRIMREELVAASLRGVPIRVILEPRVKDNTETALYLKQHGVQVKWASSSFSNTHSKLVIIDGKKVVVGSTNWSAHALNSNREASVVISDPALAAHFSSLFESDWQLGSE